MTARDAALVAWTEIARDGDFVLMERGTGERGWWHAHGPKENSHLAHPMFWSAEHGAHVCVDCPAEQTTKPQHAARTGATR